MPAIDFNSSDSGSYKNQATIIYSESDFDDLMDTNQVLTLTDPITYVTGNVELKGDQTLIIDEALLIVERDFTIGFKKNGHSRIILSLKDLSDITSGGTLTEGS